MLLLGRSSAAVAEVVGVDRAVGAAADSGAAAAVALVADSVVAAALAVVDLGEVGRDAPQVLTS